MRKHKIRRSDAVSATVLAALGAGAFYGGLSLPFGSLTRPGPGFFPTILAALLVGLSALLLIRSINRPDATARFGPRLDHLAMTLASLVLYIAFLERAGFLLLTPVLLAVMMRGMGRLGWAQALLLSVAAPAATFALFRLLGVHLPTGPLPL